MNTQRADDAPRHAEGVDRGPAAPGEKMTAMIIQPTVSSMMAEARITWPSVRRMKFISRITVATILTEAIDSAVPRNSDVISRFPGSGSIASGSASPSATPHRNGTRDAGEEAKNEARPLCAHQLEVGLHAGEQQQHRHGDRPQAGARERTRRVLRLHRRHRARSCAASRLARRCPTPCCPIRKAADHVAVPRHRAVDRLGEDRGDRHPRNELHAPPRRSGDPASAIIDDTVGWFTHGGDLLAAVHGHRRSSAWRRRRRHAGVHGVKS